MMDVCVTAYGLSSSLGGKKTACSAFRAGINRFDKARDFSCFFQGYEEPEPATVSRLPDMFFGFSGIGRLVVIVTQALEDMASGAELVSILETAQLFLVFPDPSERHIYGDFGEEDRAEKRIRMLGDRVMGQVFENLGVSSGLSNCRYYGGGQASFGEAVSDSCAALEKGKAAMCITGGFDNWTDTDTLEALFDDKRLKCDSIPLGMIPGEAGAVLCLSQKKDQHSDGVFQGQISACIEKDPGGFNDMHAGGHVLKRCIDTLVDQAGAEFGQCPWYSDINGERHRAMEWGNLQVLITQKGDGTMDSDATWVMPATGFGNTGCAHGPLCLCLALDDAHSVSPSQGECFVLLSSDDGLKSALYLASKP